MKAPSFILILVCLVGQALAIEPNEMLSVWKKNYGSLSKYEISYTQKMIEKSSEDPNQKFPVEGLVEEHRVQDANKFRTSRFVDGKQQHDISYDGIEQRIYHPINKSGMHVYGLHSSKAGSIAIFKKYFLDNCGFGPNPIEEMIRLAEDPNFSLVQCSTAEINGIACEGLRLSQVGSAHPRYEVWVAPAKGMLAIRYLWFLPNGNMYINLEVLEVDEVKGFWFPKKAHMTSDMGTFNYTQEFKINSFVLNPVTDSNTFKLEFPDGTGVWDERTKSSYTVGVSK